MKHSYFQTALAFLFSAFVCCAQTRPTNTSEDDHGHTHYPSFTTVPAHKLIFPSAVPDRIIVNLTEDPARSIAVNWRTDQSVGEGYVEVAKETHGPDFLLEGNRKRIKAETQMFENENIRDNEPLVKAAYHAALIDSLEPGTTYVYRVGDGSNVDDDGWSEWFQIQTPAHGDQTPFSFIYFGDAQNNVKSMWSRVVRKSYQMMPTVHFMLHAGDLINHSESNQEWGEWFYAGGHIHATVPSIMTPGNHEYSKGVLSALWKPQFNLPKNGPSEATQETCYAVEYKNMKLVSIDAVSLQDEEASRQAQVQWLDSVLANNTKKWTVLTMHYPIFSTAKGRDNTVLRESLLPLINKYQVDLVLQGHDHTYARGTVTNQDEGLTVQEDAGTVYAVSVSGPKMYASQDQEWMQRRGEYTQLFQIITVGQETLSYEAYTPMGSLYDAFDLQKDNNGAKKLTNREPELPERFRKDFVKGE
jgi:acid phosphatase type 7